MKLTDRDLRRLVQQAERVGAQDDPPVDALWVARAAAGELSDEERARLPALMARYPELAREIALAVDLHQGMGQGPDQAELGNKGTAPLRHHVAPRRFALAASVLLAAAAAIWFAASVPPPVAEPPVLRSEGATVEPPDGARLSAVPPTFRWEPRSLSNRYQVEILRAGGEPVWRSDWVEGTSLSPTGLRLSAGDYVWRVVARDDTNQSLAPGYAFSIDE